MFTNSAQNFTYRVHNRGLSCHIILSPSAFKEGNIIFAVDFRHPLIVPGLQSIVYIIFYKRNQNRTNQIAFRQKKSNNTFGKKDINEQ
mmetsp:Transcript_956/g.2064  ORF Transcript_956/g.2064 Transcript_956/m.2064 type:complete len:88 (-) Transcript_956:509-772(-)